MSVSCLVLRDSLWGGCLPSGLIGSLLVYCYVREDMLFAAIFTLPPTFIFNEVLRRSLAYPKTFTIGEAMIVAQAVVISSTVVVANYTWYLSEDVKMDLINVAIVTVLSTVGLIVTALCHLKQEQRTLVVLGQLIGAAAVLELVELHVLLGGDCLPRLLYFIFMNQKRRQLIGFWLFLVIVAVILLYIRTNMAVKATTTTRKVFHIMAAFVFASGVLYDISLIKLAAGLGLGLLILVEALRLSKIEPISSALQSAFLIYSDEKDCGAFAMTPIYLYLGLAGPLWLVPPGAPALQRLAGVLAAGVGDSAASWFGSRYGERLWPGSNRTMEGTLFNILSQIVTVYGLVTFGKILALFSFYAKARCTINIVVGIQILIYHILW
ncbi:dolichol kinase-like [Choristoneura fumiferana]|uniref:dolichol kinase-like n=1 Tax=Choristoneura fumiferana TaxID=7141 RepID=UPI003D15E5EC